MNTRGLYIEARSYWDKMIKLNSTIRLGYIFQEDTCDFLFYYVRQFHTGEVQLPAPRRELPET